MIKYLIIILIISMEDSINIYLKQLTEQERMVLKIAQEHLGSSFNIKKSIGYITWLNKR